MRPGRPLPALSKHDHERAGMIDYLAKARHYRRKADQLRQLAQEAADRRKHAALRELAEIYDQLSEKFHQRAIGAPL